MPRFCANLSMLFQDLPFFSRFAAARRAGFEAVEYLFPYEFDVTELRDNLERHKLVHVLHNLPAGDWKRGERGIAILPDRQAEFRRGVAQAESYASALGSTQVNCLVGKLPNGLEVAAARRTLVDNLRFAADELGKHGIRLLVEPINTIDVPDFFLSTLPQALEIIEAVGSSNVALQFDVYHMQVMQGDLARSIERNLLRIAHIQIADNPGRHEPGTGEINYHYLFSHLDSIGYAGWVGCEYIPSSVNTFDSLGWLEDAKQGASS